LQDKPEFLPSFEPLSFTTMFFRVCEAKVCGLVLLFSSLITIGCDLGSQQKHWVEGLFRFVLNFVLHFIQPCPCQKLCALSQMSSITTGYKSTKRQAIVLPVSRAKVDVNNINIAKIIAFVKLQGKEKGALRKHETTLRLRSSRVLATISRSRPESR
jgi:hypothetical protein